MTQKELARFFRDQAGVYGKVRNVSPELLAEAHFDASLQLIVDQRGVAEAVRWLENKSRTMRRDVADFPERFNVPDAVI